ncbi:TIGR02302 family protein [Sulfitobacter sp. D35]|uniref:TIGR02302 family protein n=1 Tax=Sulfitobacter sp. D35 TaxID=3083252 RepID=UPI00296FFDE1|nr:TIGR02302 family protein [Sulfitobacter sp. D35]MDW4499045.1 TIGR02302 family protein [Sulfitobacter sp. D35]
MATFSRHDARRTLSRVRWPLRLTWAGLLAERIARSFFPLMSLCLFVLAILMMGAQDVVSVEVVWAGAVFALLAFVAALGWGFWSFRWPRWSEAIARLDATLPGRPLQALMDTQAIGSQDASSTAVWRAHQARMAQRADDAERVPGDLRVASRDPYALRYVAMLAFAVALLFGSVWRVGSVAEMAPGGGLAAGPVWEGWAESPRYTGRPTIYLNDIPEGALQVPVGSLITMRLYGEVGALTLSETVSGRTEVPPASEPAQDFTAIQSGEISVDGPGGRTWQVEVIPDAAPQIAILEDPDATALGEMTLPFEASDDYGVEAGEARITLNLAAVTRRYGLAIDPDPRPDIVVPLPTPIAGDRSDFEEALIEDFSEHPWANLPVTVELAALDAAEQQALSEPRDILLPGRRFFDPVAAAVIDQRRDLLWARANGRRITQVLKAVSNRPEEIFRKETDALRLRKVIRSLEIQARYGLGEERREELAREMWDLAIILEEGDLADAAERMRRAQDRLNEAIKNGASQEEIAELMEELRRATEDYLQQLQRQAQQQAEQNGEQPPQQGQQGENSMTMSQDDLQRMMDRIQELMEQGRMAEAQQALQELQQMLENMRMAQGQQGQGGENPGQQAMEGLAETLREQQGLSDQAFRDLQEQFNPGANQGQSQGNEGRNGGQGRGQSHEGQQGEGERGNGPGDPQVPQNGQQGGGNQQAENGGLDEGSIADRQQALRDELGRQQQNLPGAGTPEGDAARDALDRAGRAMDDAEDALRRDDLAGAIDDQSRAMDALRDGMQALGEMMAEQQRQQQPGQGTEPSDRAANSRDPLGRESGNSGVNGDQSPLALNDDAYGRARELLDEIRRRSGQTERSEQERDYLKRLLDRF